MATGYGLANYASISANFTFHGKTAHAAVDPWDAKDALDASELMDVGVAYLREQLRPTYRAAPRRHQWRHPAQHDPGYWRRPGGGCATPTCRTRSADLREAGQVAKGAALMTGTTQEYQIIAAGWPQLGIRRSPRRSRATSTRSGCRAGARTSSASPASSRNPPAGRRWGSRPPSRRSAGGRKAMPRTTTATCPGPCRPAFGVSRRSCRASPFTTGRPR